MFRKAYDDLLKGDSVWQQLEIPTGEIYEWDNDSTYIKKPPYFDSMTLDLPKMSTVSNARRGLFGDHTHQMTGNLSGQHSNSGVC